MHTVVAGMFLAVLLSEFLDRYGLVPHQVTWAPELFSGVAALLVVFYLTRRKGLDLRPAYLALFILFVAVVLAGMVLNSVSSGTAFSGLRIYFKHLPFFLLPAVVLLLEPDMKRQLRLLLLLAVVQLPIALFQRFVEAADVLSGDPVRGTLINSSGLSLFLIGALAMVRAFYLKGLLSPGRFWLLTLLLFIPCTINETKGTLVLLPIALLAPALFMEGRRVREAVKVVVMGSLLLAVFIPVYDHFMEPRKGYGIVDFFTMEGRLESYLAPRLTGTAYHVGRIDAVVLPFERLGAEDPTKLMLGLGIGNVSESFLGHGFHGEYFDEYGKLIYAAVSNLLWEVGVLGTLLLFAFCAVVLRDAIALSRRDGWAGALGLGWATVTILFMVSLFYRNLLHDNAIWYLFWYLSGVVAALRARDLFAQFPALRRLPVVVRAASGGGRAVVAGGTRA